MIALAAVLASVVVTAFALIVGRLFGAAAVFVVTAAIGAVVCGAAAFGHLMERLVK